ncbi:STM3941 family protein [Enterococcus gilvus]|uniref:STM3941 family protein n=1 Tax=Enterococcus gilvus TaxID=160453 RepID=UPI002908A35A|nr:STM3941 family protein [Enterococcus gilvus]MDU5511628.1 STM3941 family protein [Enterococcus gilvus]
MEKEFVVYQSKSKQIGLALLGILMVLASFFILIAGIVETQYVLMAVGIIGFLFFGACELFIIKQVFLGKKLVVLTDAGFYDYSSALATKDKLILWKEIDKIENKSMVNQSFVSVYLKEPEQFLSGLSSLQRKAIAANVKMGFGEINITLQSAKKCNDAQLIAKMNHFMDKEFR